MELALLLPILLAMLFGVVDWSWYMYQSLAVTTAAQRGARMASGASTEDGPEAVATDAVRTALAEHGLDSVGAIVTATTVTRPYGDVVVVEIDLPFAPIVGLTGVPGKLHGRATASWYGDFGA